MSLNNARMYETAVKDQRNFNVLLDISKKLSSELDTKVLIQNIMSSAKDLLQCDRATLFLVDKEKGQLYTSIADGLKGMKEIRVPLRAGIAGSVASNAELLNIPEVRAPPQGPRAPPPPPPVAPRAPPPFERAHAPPLCPLACDRMRPPSLSPREHGRAPPVRHPPAAPPDPPCPVGCCRPTRTSASTATST